MGKAKKSEKTNEAASTELRPHASDEGPMLSYVRAMNHRFFGDDVHLDEDGNPVGEDVSMLHG